MLEGCKQTCTLLKMHIEMVENSTFGPNVNFLPFLGEYQQVGLQNVV